MVIVSLHPDETERIALVAERMRDTLVEVLGQARGKSLYSPSWLRARVLEHLERPDAEVFLAIDGAVLGHTIVREEPWSGGRLGLFSTTYVTPEARRQGVADALLEHGESWMRARGLLRAATNTAVDNTPLHRLFALRGYAVDLQEGEMVRLARDLSSETEAPSPR